MRRELASVSAGEKGLAYKWRGVNYRAFGRATDVITNAVQEVLPNKASFAVPAGLCISLSIYCFSSGEIQAFHRNQLRCIFMDQSFEFLRE